MINFKAYPALLFTPGDKPDRFHKAEEVGANGVILDLEDSVAAKDKALARETVINYLKQKRSSKLLTLIRINHLSTQAGLADVLTISNSKIFFDALIYPKAESAEDINLISAILKNLNPKLPIMTFIESARGLKYVEQIVEESENLAALLFGAGDYAVDVGCALDQNAFLLARMKIIQAAALKKIPCYDSPFFNFKDDVNLINEIRHIKSLGFSGKLAIHPNQIAIIKSSFKPSESDYNEAKEIIAAFEAVHGSACQYRGKMIDTPIYEKAKQIVEIYQQLSSGK